MLYLCLSRVTLAEGEYTLSPLKIEDMELIRVWRNVQMDVLRQSRQLTQEDQRAYWLDVIVPSFEQRQPEQILFAYEKQGDLIGYGGLTTIDWKKGSAELSFLLDPDIVKDTEDYQLCFSQFIKLLKQVAFKELSLQRLFTETFDIRPDHVAVLEASGFEFQKRLKVEGRDVDSLIHECIKDET